MRISGSDPGTPGLNLLGSMSKVGERQSNLIFVYPLLFDKLLSKKWEMILRDFQTAQFISQIKISNVLNITQAAVQGYGQTAGTPYLNPAELLNQSLSNNGEAYQNAVQAQLGAIQSQQFNNQNNNRASNSEYAYKLQELRQFIKHQILTDPIYENLRPAFSIISLENSLIDVPLIIGTKTYKIDSSALYWILFVSLLYNNTQGISLKNFAQIETVISQLPKQRFLEIITNAGLAPPVAGTGDYDASYNKLRRDVNTSLKKAMEDFKKIASLNDFEQDLGFTTSISSDAVRYTTVMDSSMAEKAEMRSKITALLNQTIVSSIFPMIQTINNLIANPALETNYMARYKILLGNILNNTDPMVDSFINLYSNRFNDVNSQEDFLKSLDSNCKSLKEIRSYDLLQRLENIRLRFTDIRRDVQIGAGTNSYVLDFAEELTRVSSSLSAETQTLVSMVKNFTGNSLIDGMYKNLSGAVKSDILKYFTETNPADYNVNPNEDREDLGDPIVNNAPGAVASRFFRSIFANADNNDLLRFLDNSAGALSELVSFLFFYSTFSYFCEFISVVKGKIEIKAKDVIEFPNYTLVIPIEFVTTLYYALAAKNTTDLLRSLNNTGANNDLTTSMHNFSLNESSIFRIISAITDRLDVKNLIIIDSNKKEIYYKWCYLKRAIKLNESTLFNYIKSQSSITSAF